jgi:hypothetical protein
MQPKKKGKRQSYQGSYWWDRPVSRLGEYWFGFWWIDISSKTVQTTDAFSCNCSSPTTFAWNFTPQVPETKIMYKVHYKHTTIRKISYIFLLLAKFFHRKCSTNIHDWRSSSLCQNNVVKKCPDRPGRRTMIQELNNQASR